MSTPPKILPVRPTKAPNLPIAPVEFDQRWGDQFANVLRLYFSQLDNVNSALLSSTGGAYVKFPYASYYTTTTQTAAAINTAYPINLDPAIFENGVYLGSPASRVYVTNSGIYNFQFSLQLAKSNASVGNIWIWYRVNGVDADYSASRIAVQGTSAQTIAAWNFLVELKSGDYFELMWAVDDTHVQIIAYPTTAFCPAIPPVIMTVTFVSAITT